MIRVIRDAVGEVETRWASSSARSASPSSASYCSS